MELQALCLINNDLTEEPKKVVVSSGQHSTVPFTQMFFTIQGLTDALSKNESPIIMLEYYQGELRLIVWSDKEEEDPTNIISLEKARI